MNIRYPVRAGSFYEASATTCRHHAKRLIDSATTPANLPAKLYGGIVPHAGWSYSGRLAAQTLVALNAAKPLTRVVLFGADHVGVVRHGEVFDSGVWQTPLGATNVDAEMSKEILAAGPALRQNPQAHAMEHSLEVQVPLLQVIAPEATILPIAVPPTADAVEVGELVGEVLARSFPDAVVVGSTDLTHHGGHFPAPGGHGEAGVEWARKNDHRMIDLMAKMDAPAVIGEAESRQNACGAGAIAAAMAACRKMGAKRGMLIEYTNSYEVIRQLYPGETDETSVGYASVVFA